MPDAYCRLKHIYELWVGSLWLLPSDFSLHLLGSQLEVSAKVLNWLD